MNRLLREVDHEFLPSLSSRIDSTSLHRRTAEPSLSPYIAAIERENWLLAAATGGLVGLLSFLTSQVEPSLVRWSPAAYITTVAVAASHRGRGVARELYGALRRYALSNGLPFLATRTWNTNGSHLRVLQSCGFAEVARDPNDRPGGLDTVYFVSAVQASMPSRP